VGEGGRKIKCMASESGLMRIAFIWMGAMSMEFLQSIILLRTASVFTFSFGNGNSACKIK
jgi:hypothetical protein